MFRVILKLYRLARPFFIFIHIYLFSIILPAAKGQEAGERGIRVRESDENHLEIGYSLPSFSFRQVAVREGEFYHLDMDGHTSISEPGVPEIPVITRFIDLTDRDIASIHITNLVTERIFPEEKGIRGKMIPVQPGLTKNEQQDQARFVQDIDAYKTDKPPVSDTVSISIIGNIRGRRIAQLQINPVIYHPASNYIDLVKSMVIDIDFKHSGRSVISKGTLSSPGFDELTTKGLLDYNPDYVTPGFTLSPPRMVIVSDTAMKKFLRPLVEWKTRKGFRVIELYVGENNLSRTFASIKDTLQYIYSNSSDQFPVPEYLIIAGDLNIIPYSDVTSILSDL